VVVHTLRGEGLTAVAQTPSFIFGTVFPPCKRWRSLSHVAVSVTTQVLTSLHLGVQNTTGCTPIRGGHGIWGIQAPGPSGLLCRPTWPVRWPRSCNESWPFFLWSIFTGASQCLQL